MEEEKKLKDNIIQDAYYLISKFNNDGKDVTNLQIQKLMYFFESYYMNIYDDVDKLYDCNFCAWAFGPVAIPLYKEFRKFGNDKIELTEENKKEGENISKDKKELLDIIYNAFKETPAIKLVELTHMQGSPWYEVWERNGRKVGYGSNTHIDKQQSKEWFRKTFEKQR